ncbi:MAG: aldehyde dehydrogenase family protein [Gammaproteobacteria bacterium]|nr:aldehyde dehydrogenase family protein [Gammaproteobacteria bacterium]
MTDIQHFPLMIAGVTKTSEHRLEVSSPYDNHIIATVDTANADDVNQVLETASTVFADRDNWLPVPQRIAILERAIVLMQQQAEQLAMGSALEGGKPLIDSRIEMTRCIDSIRICVDTLRTDVCKPVPMGINPVSQHRFTIMNKEPIGVVVAVSAFNHPLNLIAHQVGPAIAAGCPVIVKPAENTPLSCFRLVDIFHQAGLPEQWCQVILPQDHKLTEMLVTDPRVAFFSFIGSAKVGWYLRSKLAPGTRCALEHGGVAPVIMAEDADLGIAISALAKGSFYHAGQVCVSVQRIFAHESIAQNVANKLAAAAEDMIVGDPLSDQTEVGPLIRPTEVVRVSSWVQQAVDAGAELRCGGHSLPNNCYAPTVLFNPPLDSKVSTSEVFGPVVCIYPFSDLDQAIKEANALDVAFQASVYSDNINTAMYVSDRLAASAVMVNEHTAFRVDWMPFAGLRHSGLATGGIPYTMEDMQIEKMIVITSRDIH